MVIKRIPEYIKLRFEENNVTCDKLMFCVHGDMKDGAFIDVWVGFDSENLYIMTGFDKVERTKGVKKLDVSFDVTGFEIIPHKKIGALKVERFLSTARLLSEKDDKSEEEVQDTFEIASFTIGFAVRFENFIKAYKNFKEGKDVQTENRDLEEDFFLS